MKKGPGYGNPQSHWCNLVNPAMHEKITNQVLELFCYSD